MAMVLSCADSRVPPEHVFAAEARGAGDTPAGGQRHAGQERAVRRLVNAGELQLGGAY
jgi:hypothetical protein